ncbi:MAG: hypothetical protein ACR2G6_09560 [Gemmatimonadaceae bacterium]
MRHLVVIVALTLGACVDATAPARSLSPGAPAFEKIVNQKLPESMSLQNACNGEFIALTGQTHIQLNVTTTKSGYTSIRQQTTTHLAGVGLSTGASYTGTLRNSVSDHAHDPYTLVSDFAASGRLTAQGRVPNFYVRAHYHTVFNNNGQPTAEIVKFDTNCESPF